MSCQPGEFPPAVVLNDEARADADSRRQASRSVVSRHSVDMSASDRTLGPLAGLTLREVKAQLAILAICLWAVAAIDISVPGARLRSGQVKGADFLHFYVLGSLAAETNGAALYDAQALKTRQEQLVPESHGQWYVPVYGPQVALLFAPFTKLGYFGASAAWAVINFLLYVISLYIVYRHCPALRRHSGLVVLSAAAFPPFWQLVIHGQTSIIPLVGIALGFVQLRSGRMFLAGCSLGLLVVKPQLALLLFPFCLGQRGGIFALGVSVAVTAQFAGAGLVFGFSVLPDYFRALLDAPALASLLEPKPYQLHSLRGFFDLLLPTWPRVSFWSYALTATAAALVFLFAQRNKRALEVSYSLFILASVLVAPHLTVYDLVVLAPAWLLLANWLVANWDGPTAPKVAGLLYLATASTLLGPLAGVVRVQFSVPVLFALLLVASSIERQRSSAEPFQSARASDSVFEQRSRELRHSANG